MTAEKNKAGKTRKKRPEETVQPQRLPDAGSVGHILKTAREQKGISLETVSAAINIRGAQLRAIESGDIDALPGMTYALGFVKSYAAYLKLDTPAIIKKFKMEHGNPQSANQHMHFPEPIADGPQPDYVIIGAAAFCAVLILVLWSVFSGGSEKDAQMAEQIPDAPAVGTVTGIIATPPGEASLTGRNLLNAPAPVPVSAPVAAEQPPAAPVEEKAPAPVAQEPVSPPLAAVPPPVAPETAPPAPKPAPIKIKAGKSRVTLAAQKSSWVSIRDGEGNTVLEKVLRPGDSFNVPDAPGYYFATSNAGGLEILVDGTKVQPLGGPGAIVRGISLDAESLKKVKIKADRR